MLKPVDTHQQCAFFLLVFLLVDCRILTAQSAENQTQQQSDARPAGLPTLEYEKWSGDLNVPDPVALSVANNGDVYVTQTQRRKIQDLDIRKNASWTVDDIGLSSVEEKQAFYHRELAVGGDQVEQAKHVEDVNQDGQHDWRDLTVISERIHRVSDRDGDGTADEITLFADDFQTEVTGIAAGVMHWNDSVWATIAPDVWKLKDSDGDGHADQREIMATGFGLHIAYAGHDMHGLTIGPDGRVYWSIGDKGIHATSKEGKTFSYPNQGGVMRCNLDGTEFEVFAHGLRNVQEVAFDQFGNLFGVDNDADKPGEKERFVWIVDQMDAGWRCHYQYRGSAYNPWTDERLWQVAGDDHPAYIVPPIQNYYDGPAGFKFNPGAALSSKYRNYFFLTSAPNGSQYAFQTETSGDTFRMTRSHKIGSGTPIVGLDFGPDGGLYGVDWGGGYPLNQTGSVVRIDVPTGELSKQDLANRKSVQHWLTKDVADVGLTELSELLSHVDKRVRLRAQFALVKRQAAGEFETLLANPDAPLLARLHCVWGLGQLIRANQVKPLVLGNALSNEAWQVRAQAVKTLGECVNTDSRMFADLLDDSHPHVRVHAALALGRRPTSVAVARLLKLSAQIKPGDHYLRHALVTALAACAPPDALAKIASDPSVMKRLCCLLALRRQADPSAAAYLADPSDWIATEAARAIHDDRSIAQAMDALARSIEQPRPLATAMAVRSLNANFRLGGLEHSNRVIAFALQSEQPLEQRVEACDALAHWREPDLLDRVDGRRRDVTLKRSVDLDRVAGALSKLVQSNDALLRVAAVKAARNLKVDLAAEALVAIATDQTAADDLRVEAMRTLSESDQPPIELFQALSSNESAIVASESINLLVRQAPDSALATIEKQLHSKRVKVRQACIQGLEHLANERADLMLNDLASRLIEGKLAATDQLDVWSAMKARQIDSERIRESTEQLKKLPRFASMTSEKQIAFALGLHGGDAAHGEALFRTDLRGQCVRCHRIGKKGSHIGPELTKIAKTRDAEHLLRAIISPSADIEPKYNTQSLLLSDGSVLQGVITKENDDVTELLLQDGKTTEIPTDEIEAIADKKVSLMPDMTAVLSPSEVRDLVAYLKTLR